MGEGLREAGVSEIMAQLGIEIRFVLRSPGGNPLGNLSERVEMPGGIPVAPGVVGDDGLTAAEQLDQVFVCGHDGLKHARTGLASR